MGELDSLRGACDEPVKKTQKEMLKIEGEES